MDNERTELDVLQIENLQLRLASDVQDLIIAQVSKRLFKPSSADRSVEKTWSAKIKNSAPMPARNDSTRYYESQRIFKSERI